ncbi:MAG: hypothetical protein WA130_22115 [Candidatus Methanoperedens sp.]
MVREKDLIFSWNNIEENDIDRSSLIMFLKDDLNIKWVENAEITKKDDKIIISDDDKSAEIALDKKATLKFGDRTYNLEVKEENGNLNIYKETELEGIGKGFVGFHGIFLIAVYHIGLTILLLSSLMYFLSAIIDGYNLKILNVIFTKEANLIVIVALSGALGGLVHSLRSFYKYVGYRKLVWSWFAMYILLPFVGTSMGLVFYLVIRGGFFSPQAGVEQTSPFGFAALAALVGLFSEQAVLKLKEVSEIVFSKGEAGADSIASGHESGVEGKK